MRRQRARNNLLNPQNLFSSIMEISPPLTRAIMSLKH